MAWFHEVVVLRSTLALLSAVRKGDDDALRQRVMRYSEFPKPVRHLIESDDCEGERSFEADWWALIDEAGHRYPCLIVITGYPADPDADDEESVEYERQMRVAAAWDHIRSIVNNRVRGHCIAAFTRRGTADFTPVFEVVPKTLIGAIWWQFARLAMGKVSHRICEVCGSVMELSTGEHGARADKLFCTAKCKFKAHRMKMAEAKAMRAGGASLRAIAKRYGTKIHTVTRWLPPKK